MSVSADDPDKSKFFTVFEGLKQNLTARESGLAGIWNRIPADTRTPDHSIWHHCSLVSALSACKGEPYFFVFTLGPVQGFISEARKLRDLWVGSMILSYLSWAGIRMVCDIFGPDHIVYPSLSGQPFFSGWLKRSGLTDVLETFSRPQQKIASFPNKFVAILPRESVETTGRAIEDTIRKEWQVICDSVYSGVRLWAGADTEYFRAIWERQTEDLWDFYWIASPWMDDLRDSLAAELSREDRERIEYLGKLFKTASGYNTNRGLMYSGSHEVAQALHGALKNSRLFSTQPGEPGEKCTQCGRRQQLSVSEHRDETKAFWENIAHLVRQDIEENERLCSVCLVKRRIYSGRAPLPPQLTDVFGSSKFPSSTEMAFDPVKRQLKSVGRIDIWDRFVERCGGEEEAYTVLHAQDDEDSNFDDRVRSFYRELKEGAGIRLTNILGKYYAILLMDGDKMGDLVNGKAKDLATWDDIMHSTMPEKLRNSPDKVKTEGWLQPGRLTEKRHLTPSIHKAVSEALGDFALNTVPRVVSQHYGHLVYAGGDDVLAIMPIDTVLRTAQRIMELYRTPFLVRTVDGEIVPCGETYQPKKGEKLLIHLGKASTISAAVVIAHHKAPLRGLIAETHRLLERDAKDGAGRNAIAISLRKRGGAEKRVAHKWEWPDKRRYVELLLDLAKDLSDNEVSSRLMYKIDQNRVALEELASSGPTGSVEKLIEAFIEKGQRQNADKDNNFRTEQAKRLGAILIEEQTSLSKKRRGINTDGLLIARFLGQATGGR